MAKASVKQQRAVKAIALTRKDYEHTIWSVLCEMSKEQASDYIGKYGNNLSFRSN